jgi:hypothetical protein
VSERRAAAVAALAKLGIDAEALAEGRLAADALVPLVNGDDAVGLVAAVGDLGSAGAAATLVALEPHAGGAARREVRRALYRLRQRGVATPERPVDEPPPRRDLGADIEGFVSAHDASGDRLLWLVKRQASGGSLLVAAQANEPEGLRDVQAVDMSRKHLRAVRQRLAREGGVTLVAAPWVTVDALLVEAHERTTTRDRARDYLRVRAELTAEPPAAPAEPVSSHAPPPGLDEARALAAASAALLSEAPFAAWGPGAEAAAPFVAEIAALRDSPLVLNELQQRERVREVLRRAAEALYPAAAFARRLEGTAYVLAETGRGPAARAALAIAALLRARPAEGYETPFVSGAVERALGTLLSADVARQTEERRSALVATPGEVLRARESSRRGHTRG